MSMGTKLSRVWVVAGDASEVSRTGFLTQLMSKMFGINVETMLGVKIRAKLSKRAVMKQQWLGSVCLQQRRQSPIKT